MNTPTPAPVLNPVSASWKEALTTVKPLAKLYAVGFALMVAVGFAISRLVGGITFSDAINPSVLAWLPVLLVLGLLTAWYSIHVLMTLAHHRTHQPLPTPSESIRRVPQLILAGLVSILIVAGPLLLVLLLLTGAALVASAQEVGSAMPEINGDMAALNDIVLTSSGENSSMRLFNVLQGGVGMIGFLAAAIWAVYAGVRLSQASVLIIVERLKAMEAIKRSWAMTQGHFWYILGWGIVLGLFTFLLGIPAGIVDGILGFVSVTLGLLALASNALNAFLVAPWASLFTLEIYSRLKNGMTPNSQTSQQ